jgi:CheY-like chemotaxis protein/two-component sensor histidine kinase
MKSPIEGSVSIYSTEQGAGRAVNPYMGIKDTSPMTGHNILLVDDDPQTLMKIGGALLGNGYHIATSCHADFLQFLRLKHFDLMITSTGGTEADMIPGLNAAKEASPETKIIVLGNGGNPKGLLKAFKLGVSGYLVNPPGTKELFSCIDACLQGNDPVLDDRKLKLGISGLNEEILHMLMVMSHDIRGSLVSVGAGLQLLGRGVYGKMDESADRKVAELYNRVKCLAGMAEDFLGKAFAAKEDLVVEREHLDLKQDIIDPVLDELTAEIRDHDIALENCLQDTRECNLPIKANRIWLRTVFRNLFNNAIKYGGDGCTIGIGIEESGPYYRLNVYNSGEPIPEVCRDKLFTKFASLSGKESRSNGSIGLGLYMVKDIIEKHGGEITYEAQRNGSSFVFTLPVN